MVEIEPLTEEDQVTLQRALIAHRDYTGSVPAQSILDDFNLHAGAFVKIFPKDYKAALAKSASDGIAETEASTLEGHHG
jgi:glutamate synthase (NADPH/NADH) large chain